MGDPQAFTKVASVASYNTPSTRRVTVQNLSTAVFLGHSRLHVFMQMARLVELGHWIWGGHLKHKYISKCFRPAHMSLAIAPAVGRKPQDTSKTKSARERNAVAGAPLPRAARFALEDVGIHGLDAPAGRLPLA